MMDSLSHWLQSGVTSLLYGVLSFAWAWLLLSQLCILSEGFPLASSHFALRYSRATNKWTIAIPTLYELKMEIIQTDDEWDLLKFLHRARKIILQLQQVEWASLSLCRELLARITESSLCRCQCCKFHPLISHAIRGVVLCGELPILPWWSRLSELDNVYLLALSQSSFHSFMSATSRSLPYFQLFASAKLRITLIYPYTCKVQLHVLYFVLESLIIFVLLHYAQSNHVSAL